MSMTTRVWTDEEIGALVERVLAALPPAEPIPFTEPHPRLLAHPSFSKSAVASWGQRQKLWGKTGGRCAYCAESLQGLRYEIDHVVPRFLGGPDRMINKLPACYPCNVQKGGGLPRLHDQPPAEAR